MFGLLVSLLICAAPGEPAHAEPAGPRVPPNLTPLFPVDDHDERVLTFKRERLDVRPLHRPWVTPMTLAPMGDYDDEFTTPGWNQTLPSLAPMPEDPVGEWGIVRGNVEILDDIDLANLLHDQAMHDRITSERFWPRLWWGVGFGAASAASLGTGSWMTWRHYGNDDAERNGQAIGISLLAVGVATGLLAVLYPAYAQHVLTPPEAAQQCDRYNEALRRDLRLEPEDLQRF